jgi:nitrogen fixation/metabolism regulation signal transduction histidine kinase
LQDRLASVKLGSKNEAIQWKSRDEIGTLIDEYNGMLAELAASAEKLAKSERESAWREMAKQVAHEIKNPLTPMKLNTQMLKRAWEDKAPGFEERLNRYAQNLIEQIDTLSHIATEFGNFAQMPRMQKEEVDMRSLLQHVAEFHENQHCSIHFTNDGSKSYVVLTDKEQMLRAFNNLIRNAEQAIPDDRKGEIGLRLKRANDRVVIQVSDNGKGIPSELQERIFRPNFTTKTTGMGLGLALVKNIVESSDGQIHFETEVDRGTTFTLELPAV